MAPVASGSRPSQPQAPTVPVAASAAGLVDGIATMDWAALTDAVAACQACELCTGRRAPVFGGADAQAPRRADWLVVGESTAVVRCSPAGYRDVGSTRGCGPRSSVARAGVVRGVVVAEHRASFGPVRSSNGSRIVGPRALSPRAGKVQASEPSVGCLSVVVGA